MCANKNDFLYFASVFRHIYSRGYIIRFPVRPRAEIIRSRFRERGKYFSPRVCAATFPRGSSRFSLYQINDSRFVRRLKRVRGALKPDERKVDRNSPRHLRKKKKNSPECVDRDASRTASQRIIPHLQSAAFNADMSALFFRTLQHVNDAFVSLHYSRVNSGFADIAAGIKSNLTFILNLRKINTKPKKKKEKGLLQKM